MAYGAIYRKTLNLNSRVKARLDVLLGVTLVTAACATGPLWSPPPEGAADPRAAAPEFTFVSDTFAFANLIRARHRGEDDLYANYCFVLARGLRQFSQFALRSRAAAARSRWLRGARATRRGAPGVAAGVVGGRADRHPRLRQFTRVLTGGRGGGEGRARLPLLDARALDQLAGHLLGDPRPPGARGARDRERAARGAARAAPGHQLAQARAEPHRRRVRVARRGLHRRLRRLGPERPRRAGDRHLRSSRGALLGDPGLRYRARRDPGLSHVLLTAPLRVARLRVAVRAGGRRGAAVRAEAEEARRVCDRDPTRPRRA